MTLCRKLHSTSHEAKHRTITVDNKEAMVLEEVSRVPITVSPMITELSCLVVCTTPYDLIIYRLVKKNMKAFLDIDKDVATFCHDKEVKSILLVIEDTDERRALSLKQMIFEATMMMV